MGLGKPGTIPVLEREKRKSALHKKSSYAAFFLLTRDREKSKMEK